MSDDLCYLSAVDAISLFANRRLSPVELVDALISRIGRVNPALNALINPSFERARAQAARAEQRYAKGRPRPLEGVPLVVKDFHPVKGELTTMGSIAFRDHRPTESAPTVERLLRAGAILLARSTTPELAFASATHSPLWGVTYNPWNRDFAPGGSSGGAAAALAAGLTTLADGTDHGGSIRNPAGCCGIVGYKPPYGRNPLPVEQSLDTFLHYGPMTRTVEDAALMQNVMSGHHARDISTLRQRLRLPTNFEGIRGWRVAWSMDLGIFEIDPEVQRNTLEALAIFRDLGCEVVEVDPGWDARVLAGVESYYAGGTQAGIAPIAAKWRYAMADYILYSLDGGLSQFDRGSGVRVEDFISSFGTIAQMYQSFGPILERFDVFICPTNALPSVPAEFTSAHNDLVINGKKLTSEIQWMLTWPFNMLSRCPVMSVPSGRADNGIPTGIQIVGRTYDDRSVFRAAAAYQAARPWLATPSDRPSLE